jgi:hypothetical protein
MNKDVALLYQARMEAIGVEINKQKSFISEGKPPFGEFAKRVFVGDHELTGLPMDILLECSKSIYMIPDLIGFLRSRWDIVQISSDLYAPSMLPNFQRKEGSIINSSYFQSTIRGRDFSRVSIVRLR